MIDVTLNDDKFKLVVNAVSDKQNKFFRSLIKKIPGYEYIASGKHYYIPLVELKSLITTLGNNCNYLDDKRIITEKYNIAIRKLKESLYKYNPSNFLKTLDTNKNYPFLKIDPYKFQKVAIEWGSAKKGASQIYGGLIADQVGLGKTFEAIAIVSNLIEQGICKNGIILCPSNMGEQWKEEIERFSNKTARVIYSKYSLKKADGFKNVKEKRIQEYKDFKEDFLIVGHELFARQDADDIQELKNENEKLDFSFIIVDEAHKMKNINSQLYQKVSMLNPQVKLLLTATPAKRDIDDIFSLFNYLDPQILTSWNYFKNKFLIMVTKKNGQEFSVGSKKENEPFLHSLIAPYMIRRQSKDVSDEIPGLVEKFIAIVATKEQRKWIDILYKEMERALKDAERALNNDDERLAKMKEGAFMSKHSALVLCSDHLKLLDTSNSKQTLKLLEQHGGIKDYTSPKLEWLVDFIENNIIYNNEFLNEEKEKLVVFSQSTRMLDYIEEELLSGVSKDYPNRVKIMKFTGKMSKGCERSSKDNLPINCFECKRRDKCETTEKSKFMFVNDPNVNVLLCSDAAQAGINLQVARFLINFDLPYSPGSIDQRIGRIKRIGSKFSQVIAYNLYTDDSLDNTIVNTLKTRRASIDKTVESTEKEKQAYLKGL